jgi:hypothetical protein
MMNCKGSGRKRQLTTSRPTYKHGTENNTKNKRDAGFRVKIQTQDHPIRCISANTTPRRTVYMVLNEMGRYSKPGINPERMKTCSVVSKSLGHVARSGFGCKRRGKPTTKQKAKVGVLRKHKTSSLARFVHSCVRNALLEMVNGASYEL